jgi:autotransporter-associated beta strand protein
VQAGSLNFAQPTDVTVANTIRGAGSIAKTGAGTLTLTGANTYTGGTTVSQGTLVGNSTSIRGALANNAAVVFNQPTNGTFTGAISGSGSLAKEGAGNLTLSGVNTSTGPTFVKAGTLTVTGGNALGDNALVVIASGATLAVAQSETVGSLSGVAGANVTIVGGQTLTTEDNSASSFAGTISGAGGVRQNFAGTTTMSGTSTYTGATNVANGTLVINGSITSSSGVTVANGATLGGSGQLPSTTVFGTISPGNSPGILTVNGNLTLNASSLYIAEVQGAVADRINVTGTASLAGTLRLVPLGGAYSFNSPYTLLAAAGGASGTFGTVDTTGSFGDGVTTAVSYTGNNVLLTLTPKKITTLGVTAPANAFAVASAIDGAVASGADASSLFALYNLPAAAIPTAVNQLSGEIHTGVPALAARAAGQFLGTMLDGGLAGRLQNAGPAPGAAAFSGRVSKGSDVPAQPRLLDEPRFSLWGAAFGSAGRTDGDAAIGAAKRNLDDAHLAVGADMRIGAGSVAGVAVSGGKGRASLPGGLGRIESDVFQAGVYGATRIGMLNLSAAGGYARLDNDVVRSVPALGNTLTSSYASTAWSGRLQANAAVASWNGFTLSPLAALQAVHVRSPAFVEQAALGGNAAALAAGKRNDMTSRAELGAQIDMQTLLGGVPVTGFVRAAWAHYFERDASLTANLVALPGASFTATGVRPDRNGVLFAAGLDAKLSERVSLGVRLDSELSANTRTLGGTAQLKVSF